MRDGRGERSSRTGAGARARAVVLGGCALIAAALGLTVCLDGGRTSQPGARCTATSGCEAPRVCQYGRCREPCLLDVDCPGGVCLSPETPGAPRVCSLPDESGCAGCEGLCVDGVCVQPTPGLDGGPDGDGDGDGDEADGDEADGDEPDADGYGCVALGDRVVPGLTSEPVGAAAVDVGATAATLEFVVDLNGTQVSTEPELVQIHVGLRTAGNVDFVPFGHGGWVVLYCGDDTPSPDALWINDKVHLQAEFDQGEGVYDIVGTPEGFVVHAAPIGSTVNYGIWFDRDSVDPWQAGHWGAVDGGTFNTGGVYRVRVVFFRVSEGRGGMLATVNGVATGFFDIDWRNGEPDHYPAGLSFEAELAAMQPFVASTFPASGSPVPVRDIELCGRLVP